jgi:prepilin-type N-terminal cleavage/methylation domain-containing protein
MTFLSLCIRTKQWLSSHRMRTRRDVRRSGVTLIEVLLVLAILAAVAGMAAPTIDSMLTSRRVFHSADELVNDLLEARVRAIKTGQAQVFSATISGRDYSITPWMGNYDEIDASAGATITTSTGLTIDTEASAAGATSSPASGEVDVKELLEDVQFYSVETLIDSRNAAAIQSEGGTVAAPASGGVSKPVLFYPDGSSTTAMVILVDSRGRRIAIQLRGIVGQITRFQTTSVDPPAMGEAP